MSYPANDPKASWLWDFLKHSENIFTNLIIFFLFAESMLMVSYATVANALPSKPVIMFVIAVLGIFFTGAWVCINKRSYKNMGDLLKRVSETIPLYREIREERTGLRSNWVLGFILPSVTFIAWVVLFIFFWIYRG